MDDRLYRSVTDRSLAGVCGGVAAWLGLDPSLVRIVWVLLALMSGGVFVIVYIVMAIVVPDAPPGWTPRGRVQQPPPGAWGPGTGPTWGSSAPGGAWNGTQGGWSATPTGDPAASGAQGPGAMPPGAPPPGAPGPGSVPPGPAPSSWPEDWGRHGGSWDHRHRGDQAGIVVGGVLVVLGVWFLVRDYIAINWDLVWPVAVIALGGLLIAGAARRAR